MEFLSALLLYNEDMLLRPYVRLPIDQYQDENIYLLFCAPNSTYTTIPLEINTCKFDHVPWCFAAYEQN